MKLKASPFKRLKKKQTDKLSARIIQKKKKKKERVQINKIVNQNR